MIKKIIIVARGYPTKDDSSMAFIQPVARRIADMGIECIVIAPQSINGKTRYKKARKTRWVDKTANGNDVVVLQPVYFSFGPVKIKGTALSTFFKEKCVTRCIKQVLKNGTVDIVYGHFWDCALLASKKCQSMGIPIVVGSGESVIDINRYYSCADVKSRIGAICGGIFVSTKNYQESKSKSLVDDDFLSVVLPNAIDPDCFYLMDKHKCREKLGIKEDDFVVAYVGGFSERKGVKRLIEASNKIDGLKLILIGDGEKIPVDNRVIYASRVAHENVVEYLNAADVYCLPTLAEGCCNSIIEAMACGLPIISSDLSFNYDILNKESAELIDPLDISAIRNALITLKADDKKREVLSKKSMQIASQHTIDNRVNSMITFFENVK